MPKISGHGSDRTGASVATDMVATEAAGGTSHNMQIAGLVSERLAGVLVNSGTLTISSGTVTATGWQHKIDTEGAASTDDLDTVNGGTDGQLLILSSVSGARVVTVKNGTGNLNLVAGDFALDDTMARMLLQKVGTDWYEISRDVPVGAPGSGDMMSTVYDPTTVVGDAFDMGNMVEAANALVLTAAERALIAGIGAGSVECLTMAPDQGTGLVDLRRGIGVVNTSGYVVTQWGGDWAQATVADRPTKDPDTLAIDIDLTAAQHLDGAGALDGSAAVLVGVAFKATALTTGVLLDAHNSGTGAGFLLRFASGDLVLEADGNTTTLSSAGDTTAHAVAFSLVQGTGVLYLLSEIVGSELVQETWGALPAWNGQAFETLGDPTSQTGSVTVFGAMVRSDASFSVDDVTQMLNWIDGMGR